MLHGQATPATKDPSSPYKMKLGVWMFLLYGLIYAGFIGINLVSPTLMEKSAVMGLNLAVTYGFGLIIFALILALIYDRLCTSRENKLAGEETIATEPPEKGE